MRSDGATIESHTAGEVTTTATCWKVTLRDNTVLGFTDHDQPLTFGGVTYQASTGYTASAIESKVGLEPDNLELLGVVGGVSVLSSELRAGRWDYAQVEIFLVNWADPTAGQIILRKGRLGEISQGRTRFQAELFGLSKNLQQRVGRLYMPSCDADLGDTRCKIVLATFGRGTVAGTLAVWIYNEPLTQKATAQLNDIDRELALVQATLESSEQELARALRIVDATQAALEKLTQQTSSAETLFEVIQSTLDDRLLPELKTTRNRIESARVALENLQSVLDGVSNFIPGVDLGVPTRVIGDLISSANSLDAEIVNVETLAQQASVFVSDTSYLLGGDLTETRDRLQNFLTVVEEYQVKVADWRAQIADLVDVLPTWIDRASISLTIFLRWFGLS